MSVSIPASAAADLGDRGRHGREARALVPVLEYTADPMRAAMSFLSLMACGATPTSPHEPGPTTGAEAAEPAPIDCDEPFATKAAEEPPFSGTVYVDPDIIREDDPTAFSGLEYRGQEERKLFDRRVNGRVTVDAYVFDARFGASKRVEFRVNPEMSREQAEAEAETYARALGRIPAFLFRELEEVSIHGGKQLFGGGERGLLVHVEQGEVYMKQGLLEETLVHEASHTSMDRHHAKTARWLEAQAADGTFISNYARETPEREDVAESLGPYLAVRHRADRIDDATRAKIEAAMPARIRYFDCVPLAIDPLP